MNGGVEFDELGGFKGVVGFEVFIAFFALFIVGAGFGDTREGDDPEGAEIGDALFCADAKGVFAEGGVGSNLEDAGDLFAAFGLNIGNGDAGTVENDFLGIVEAVAGDGEGDFGAELASARHDGVGDGVEGEKGGEGE